MRTGTFCRGAPPAPSELNLWRFTLTKHSGRLKSRPRNLKNRGSLTTGLRHMGLETDHDGLLYVPESFNSRGPSPLIVMLHGAGGNAHHGIHPLRELADRTGTILLAPESQNPTWDLLSGHYAQDAELLDEALNDAFSLYEIDPERLAIGGFSDGASYALSLGIVNGDLFSHIMAFSPGFFKATELRGSPQVFISHGTNDQVLPIDPCSRTIAPRLRAAELDVDYHEFDGGHTVPTDIGRRAFKWFLGDKGAPDLRQTTVRSPEAGLEFT